MTTVHPTAVVDSHAEFGCDVEIGPFCVVQRGVRIGNRCRLASHVVIREGVDLGSDNQIGEGSVIGGPPQHLKAGPRVGRVHIGRANTIREHVTIHCGLDATSDTVIGDFNYIMVNAHIAHDCQVGNHTILVNNVMLAGHVIVQDRAYISGGVGVHQFCRVGKYAMISGVGRITQDVPPYVLVDGLARHVVGLNIIGLRRNGFSRAEIGQMKEAYRVIYRRGLSWSEILETLAQRFPDGPAAEFRRFFEVGGRGRMRAVAAKADLQGKFSVVSQDADDGDSAVSLGRAA